GRSSSSSRRNSRWTAGASGGRKIWTRRWSISFRTPRASSPARCSLWMAGGRWLRVSTRSDGMDYAVGIDLGGPNVKAVAVSKGEALLEQAVFPTEDAASVPWAARVRDHLATLQARQSAPACRIGLAAPGLASPDARCIAWMQGRLDA